MMDDKALMSVSSLIDEIQKGIKTSSTISIHADYGDARVAFAIRAECRMRRCRDYFAMDCVVYRSALYSSEASRLIAEFIRKFNYQYEAKYRELCKENAPKRWEDVYCE